MRKFVVPHKQILNSLQPNFVPFFHSQGGERTLKIQKKSISSTPQSEYVIPPPAFFFLSVNQCPFSLGRGQTGGPFPLFGVVLTISFSSGAFGPWIRLNPESQRAVLELIFYFDSISLELQKALVACSPRTSISTKATPLHMWCALIKTRETPWLRSAVTLRCHWLFHHVMLLVLFGSTYWQYQTTSEPPPLPSLLSPLELTFFWFRCKFLYCSIYSLNFDLSSTHYRTWFIY